MYHAPRDLDDALKIAHDFDGRIVAGGTDVFPSTRQGHRPGALLDITGISGLGSITQDANGTRIGAAVTWSDIVRADLPPAFAALQQAGRAVGGIQIQNAGTLAGNLCNASPAADGAPTLLILEAMIEVASLTRGIRQLPLADFLLGVRRTALARDELLTAITVPPAPARAVSAFEKLGNRKYLVISTTMTAALIVCDKDGKISLARIAVGACSPVAKRLVTLEQSLIGQAPDDLHIDPAHISALSPIDDVRGSKEFRLDAVAEQCRRAIKRAAQNG